MSRRAGPPPARLGPGIPAARRGACRNARAGAVRSRAAPTPRAALLAAGALALAAGCGPGTGDRPAGDQSRQPVPDGPLPASSANASALALVQAALARTGGSDALASAGGLLLESEGTKNAGAEYQGFHPDSLSPGRFRERLAFAPAGSGEDREPGLPEVEDRRAPVLASEDVAGSLRVAYEYRHDRFDGTRERIRERYGPGDRRVIFVLERGFAVHLVSAEHGAARARLLRRHPGLLLDEVRRRAAGLRDLGRRGELDVVSASLEGGEVVDLGFDTETGLLREVGYVTDAPGHGDAAVRWRFGDYRAVEGAGLVPRTYGVSIDGRPFTEMRVTRAEAGRAAAALLSAPPGFEVPEEPQEIPAGGDASSGAEVREVAQGVFMAVGLRGGFHPLFVEFEDFVVALDAPAGYPLWDELPASDVAPGPTADWLSRRYLQLMAEAVPDKPVRYVVITHFHNDHAGGVRAFVAEGATVLASPPAAGAIQALVRAPHTLAPDRLAREGGELRLEVVEGHRELTDGSRTLEVIDVGPNPHTAAMLVVRLRDEDLWFVSDLLDPAPVERFPKPEHAALDRWFAGWLEREGRAPERIFTMHGTGLVTPEHLERLRAP